MNIVEAVREGKRQNKRIRRKGVLGYLPKDLDVIGIRLTTEQLLADDWKVEEKEVAVSASRLKELYKLYIKDQRGMTFDMFMAHELDLL